MGELLQRSREVDAHHYETREENRRRFQVQFSDAPELVNATRKDSRNDSWWFHLPCATDFAAVRDRLASDPAVQTVWCARTPAVKPS